MNKKLKSEFRLSNVVPPRFRTSIADVGGERRKKAQLDWIHDQNFTPDGVISKQLKTNSSCSIVFSFLVDDKIHLNKERKHGKDNSD